MELGYIFCIILCSSQTRLWPLPVQTQGMQLLKMFIQVYYNNSHQQYENVTIEVSHSSMFKNHSSCKSYYVQNRTFKSVRQLKDSWGSYTATGSEITEKEQLPCNTYLNRAYFRHDYIISPTRHREIVEIELHPEIDTKWFIEAKNQMQVVFNKENQMPKHLLLKIHWE